MPSITTTALAAAMEAAATLASADRWASLCDQLGVEGAHQHVLDAVAAYREAWEQATADSIGTSETAMAFAELETALRLAAPGPAPAHAVLTATRACLRPWGLPGAADKPPTAPEAAHAHASGGLPPARAMAVGGAYTELYGGDEAHDPFARLQRSIEELVKSSRAQVAFLMDANGELLAASGQVDDLDTISLASLAEGWLPSSTATDAPPTRVLHRARLGETKRLVHLHLVARRVILVLIFEASHVGIVGVRLRHAVPRLESAVEGLVAGPGHGGSGPSGTPSAAPAWLRVITDEDLRHLFG